MRKKVSVDTIRRNGDTSEAQKEKNCTSDISETPLNGNHTEDDDPEKENFDEDDDKDSSLDQDEAVEANNQQQELP